MRARHGLCQGEIKAYLPLPSPLYSGMCRLAHVHCETSTAARTQAERWRSHGITVRAASDGASTLRCSAPRTEPVQSSAPWTEAPLHCHLQAQRRGAEWRPQAPALSQHTFRINTRGGRVICRAPLKKSPVGPPHQMFHKLNIIHKELKTPLILWCFFVLSKSLKCVLHVQGSTGSLPNGDHC